MTIEVSPVKVSPIRQMQMGTMKVEVYADRTSAGSAAARAAAESLIHVGGEDAIGVIFATGASQFETLAALTAMSGLPWERIVGFHMDEYLGISPDHPASFRRYLRERLTSKVAMKEFLEVEGSTEDADEFCRWYAEKLRTARPQVCLLGIGENGHLAFNDPPVADFNDPVDVKVVTIDAMCRQQQTAEGWFKAVEDVPEQAITLTLPALMRVPRLIASVPGSRKAEIMLRTLTEEISTACPSTLLRTHPDVTVFLDADSAAALD